MRDLFVVFDRDGTLIEYVPYLTKVEQITLIAGVDVAIRRLNELGIPVVVITNQSLIGRGLATEKQVFELNSFIVAQLGARGATIDHVYLCPHRPEDNCQCRKPRTQLLEVAARSFDLNPSQAVVIGDNHVDMQLALNAGALGLHVQSRVGYVPSDEFRSFVSPLDAVTWLLSQDI